MKNTHIQKTTPVSKIWIEKQIITGGSTGENLPTLKCTSRLATMVGLAALSITVVSLPQAVSAKENPQTTNLSRTSLRSEILSLKASLSNFSEQRPLPGKVVVSSLTVPLESTEKEPKPVLLAERKEIFLNQLTPLLQLKNSLNNFQQTRHSLSTNSLKVLRQEESKLKGVLAAVPIKIGSATQTELKTTQISLDVLNNTNKVNSSNIETAVVIPVQSPEDSLEQTEENQLSNELPSQDNSTNVVKSTNIEVPSIVSPEEKEDFNNTAIEIIPPEQNNQPEIYKVQQGDTLNKIAYRYGVNVNELMALNRIVDPNVVKINQQLMIPTTTQKVTSATSSQFQSTIPVVVSNSSPSLFETNSTLQQITSKKLKQSDEEKISNVYTSKLKSQVANLEQTSQSIPVELPPSPSEQKTFKEKLPKPNLVGTASWDSTPDTGSVEIPVDEPANPDWLNNPEMPVENLPPFTGYIWPAKGSMTSGYGRRWGRMHKGIDIAASTGTPVVAAASGEVISAGWTAGGYGNLVVLKHADRSITYYAHNSRILVRKGQIVQQGEQVSSMGSTGRSTGPHLHFELHRDGRWAVNPIAFLPNNR